MFLLGIVEGQTPSEPFATTASIPRDGTFRVMKQEQWNPGPYDQQSPSVPIAGLKTAQYTRGDRRTGSKRAIHVLFGANVIDGI